MTARASDGATAAPAHPRQKTLAPALLVATLALVLACGLALQIGEPISFGRALRDPASLDRAILLHARLPRVLLGVIAGGGLAITGACFQALLRNPLAEPYVLGVAGGAALGATLALALGAASLVAVFGSSLTALAAATFGLLATAVVYGASSRASREGGEGRGSATTTLLAGVIVNAIAAAAITFVKTLVPGDVARQLLFWLAGFLDVPAPGPLAVVATCVALGSIVLLREAPRLNLLALGDDHAGHLGVDVRRLERRLFIGSSLVVGAVVASCGMIGFVGLLVPHVVRRLTRSADQRVVVPTSLIAGAAMLVLCDAGARLIFRWAHTEPPVGAITALLGGPLFLVLLVGRQGHRRVSSDA